MIFRNQDKLHSIKQSDLLSMHNKSFGSKVNANKLNSLQRPKIFIAIE